MVAGMDVSGMHMLMSSMTVVSCQLLGILCSPFVSLTVQVNDDYFLFGRKMIRHLI